MPGAARLGDLIGHAPPIPPVTAAAMMGAALGTTGRLLVGSAGLTSGALTGALSATGIATGPEPQAGGGDGVGVGGVVTGKIVGPCSGNVFVNGIPAARALIDMAVCSLHPPVPIPIVSGSSNVFINGMPAARLGDKIFCGAVNLTASGNVFIGGSAGGSGQTVQVGPVMPEDTAAPLVRAPVLAAAAGAVPEITPDLFGPNVLGNALESSTSGGGDASQGPLENSSILRANDRKTMPWHYAATQPTRIEMVMSHEGLKFGSYYGRVAGFSMGIPVDNDGFMFSNTYPVGPGVGVAFADMAAWDGKSQMVT